MSDIEKDVEKIFKKNYIAGYVEGALPWPFIKISFLRNWVINQAVKEADKTWESLRIIFQK